MRCPIRTHPLYHSLQDGTESDCRLLRANTHLFVRCSTRNRNRPVVKSSSLFLFTFPSFCSPTDVLFERKGTVYNIAVRRQDPESDWELWIPLITQEKYRWLRREELAGREEAVKQLPHRPTAAALTEHASRIVEPCGLDHHLLVGETTITAHEGHLRCRQLCREYDGALRPVGTDVNHDVIKVGQHFEEFTPKTIDLATDVINVRLRRTRVPGRNGLRIHKEILHRPPVPRVVLENERPSAIRPVVPAATKVFPHRVIGEECYRVHLLLLS